MTRVRKGVLLGSVLSFFVLCGVQGAPPLRISLPPVLASLPIAFAEEWGLFDEHGVDVQIIGMTDSLVRSAALATGALDSVVEDITQFIVDVNGGGGGLVVTSAAYVDSQTESLQVALVSPGSFRLETVDDLVESKQRVGTIMRSDHEYLLDQLFDVRLNGDQTWPRYSYLTDILALATLFGAQMMPAVVLPEPYISYLTAYTPPEGFAIEVVTLCDFSEFETLPNLLVFREDYVEAHPDAVEAFYAAYVDAIERLNETTKDEVIAEGLDVVLPLFFRGANPDLIGQDVLDALSIPSFDLPVELPREQYESVLAWAHEKGYALVRPEYDVVVDRRFVP
jgi:ABC-type nitrate/sulfonate/bicarbonate transport system substrate-binding protein